MRREKGRRPSKNGDKSCVFKRQRVIVSNPACAIFLEEKLVFSDRLGIDTGGVSCSGKDWLWEIQ